MSHRDVITRSTRSIIYEVIPLHIYNGYKPNDPSRRTPVEGCFCNYNEHLLD